MRWCFRSFANQQLPAGSDTVRNKNEQTGGLIWVRWWCSCQPEALAGLVKPELAGRLFLWLLLEHLSTLILNLAKLTRFDIKGVGSSVKIKHVFVNCTRSKPGTLYLCPVLLPTDLSPGHLCSSSLWPAQRSAGSSITTLSCHICLWDRSRVVAMQSRQDINQLWSRSTCSFTWCAFQVGGSNQQLTLR